MTKKDKAIEWFTMLREKFTGTEYGEYLDMAIKALEQQPCEEREQGKCPFYAS